MERNEAIALGRSSAEMGLDDGDIDSYFENLSDTLRGAGVTDPRILDAADAEFIRVLRESGADLSTSAYFRE